VRGRDYNNFKPPVSFSASRLPALTGTKARSPQIFVASICCTSYTPLHESSRSAIESICIAQYFNVPKTKYPSHAAIYSPAFATVRFIHRPAPPQASVLQLPNRDVIAAVEAFSSCNFDRLPEPYTDMLCNRVALSMFTFYLFIFASQGSSSHSRRMRLRTAPPNSRMRPDRGPVCPQQCDPPRLHRSGSCNTTEAVAPIPCRARVIWHYAIQIAAPRSATSSLDSAPNTLLAYPQGAARVRIHPFAQRGCCEQPEFRAEHFTKPAPKQQP
jgi:hypothetical protein